MIKGTIITLPNTDKIEKIYISLGPKLYYIRHLDSLGVFSTDTLRYGTHTLQIFIEDNHYPICIQNVVLNSDMLDVGELPLFTEKIIY